MEGYFPIHEYCRLANITTDTAYHRTNRKTVPSFKDSEGKVFIYFSDNRNIELDGYCRLKEYCNNHHVGYTNIRSKIGNIIQDYIIIDRDPKARYRTGIYVRKDMPIPERRSGTVAFKNTIKSKCPEGYICCAEWAEREKVEKYNVYNWMRQGLIDYVYIEKHKYINESITKEDVYASMKRRRIKNGNEDGCEEC